MTELGTVVAAGRLLPAACLPPTLPVLGWPSLSRMWRDRLPPLTPLFWGGRVLGGELPAGIWGAGKAEEELGHPAAPLSWDVRTAGDKGGGLGDTYLINWPRSSHRVSQPGHLHSPCP